MEPEPSPTSGLSWIPNTLFRVICFKLKMMGKNCIGKIIALKKVHSLQLGKSLSGKSENWSLDPKPHKNGRWTWWPFCNFSTWKSEAGDPESKLNSCTSLSASYGFN